MKGQRVTSPSVSIVSTVAIALASKPYPRGTALPCPYSMGSEQDAKPAAWLR